MKFEQNKVCGQRPGTKLILSGLHECQEWRQKQHVLDLQRKLSGMLSPFEEANDFSVHLEVDGKTLELAEISKKVRETALLRYVFKFDGQVLEISGSAKLKYFQPRAKDGETLFKSLCEKTVAGGFSSFLPIGVERADQSTLCFPNAEDGSSSLEPGARWMTWTVSDEPTSWRSVQVLSGGRSMRCRWIARSSRMTP